MRFKTLLFVAVLGVLVGSVTAVGLRQWQISRQPKPVGEQLPDAVIVYCFHGNTRDLKYEKVEKLAHEVLEKSFAKELKDGRLVWRIINYQTPDHAQLVADLQVTKPCLMVADARQNGTCTAENLQRNAWKWVDDPEAFGNYLCREVRKAIKANEPESSEPR
jgi:hypothetical protein